jgi:DNA-directed RNA polymerase specialized sigma24 family protein
MSAASPNQDSITVWFSQLRAGDPLAAAKLWDRFFERLVVVAGQQMATVNRRVADEEDIATGVMAALCRCAGRGQLPAIDNRDDLWQQLLRWTKHDVIDHVRASTAAKRGSKRVRGNSVFSKQVGADDIEAGFDSFADRTATPDLLVEMDEQLNLLLDRLPEPLLRQLALMKMEGYSSDEIASELGVSPRTVSRKLNLIRSYWSDTKA